MRPQGWVTVIEAAILVGRTHWAVRKWITRGHLTAIRTDTGTIVVDGRRVLEVEASLYERRASDPQEKMRHGH